MSNKIVSFAGRLAFRTGLKIHTAKKMVTDTVHNVVETVTDPFMNTYPRHSVSTELFNKGKEEVQDVEAEPKTATEVTAAEVDSTTAEIASLIKSPPKVTIQDLEAVARQYIKCRGYEAPTVKEFKETLPEEAVPEEAELVDLLRGSLRKGTEGYVAIIELLDMVTMLNALNWKVTGLTEDEVVEVFQIEGRLGVAHLIKEAQDKAAAEKKADKADKETHKETHVHKKHPQVQSVPRGGKAASK